MVSPAALQHKKRQLQDDGYCVVPEVLDLAQTAFVRERLLRAADEFRRRGESTFMPVLDPNDSNVRVFNLLDLDGVFRDLIRHPLALSFVNHLLGEHFLISNFTANIARPGSRSMNLHSDQALVTPPPWLAPWSMNVIWCLDDVYEENGATRFVPDSHRCTEPGGLPDNAVEHTVPFEARAGSFIVMDGRVWHTSGANVTEGAERALLFGFYSADFVRPQVNWNALLSDDTQASLDSEMQAWLGLGPEANVRYGGALVTGHGAPC